MLEEAVEYVKFLQKQIQVLPALNYFEILWVSKKIQADNEIMKTITILSYIILQIQIFFCCCPSSRQITRW